MNFKKTKLFNFSFRFFIIFFFFNIITSLSFAANPLSYSGRLVHANGSPVAGPVTIRAELAYTNAPATILCTQDIPNVVLTKGVFHIKLELTCSAPPTLNEVLAQTPAGESVAIRITDVTNSKSYSFQALHSIPFANLSEQLVQMGATAGQVLKWNGTKWAPDTAGGGGTVTNVTATSPLTISSGGTTPAITISKADTSTNGYLSSVDWNAFNSKQSALPSGGGNTDYYRGDNSWQTLNSDAVLEGMTNLYFSNALALGVPLAGLTPVDSLIVDNDLVLNAFGKAQGQITAIKMASGNYLIKNDNTTGDAVTGIVTVGTTGLLQLVYTPVGANDATNKSYVDSLDQLKLAKAGGVMSGVLTLDNDLKIKGGGNYVTIKGHASSGAYNLILPSSAGLNNEVLQTDGSGNLSWVNPSSLSAGSGTVDSTSITDGSIVDADVNASAAIAQSKIAGLTTALGNKVSTTLTTGNILVGNASNLATAVSVSGDATLSNAGVVTLKNTGTAGTYTSVVTDAQGRVTSGSSPTTLAGYGITDALVKTISVNAPITNTGTGTNPILNIPLATNLVSGYLSASDWTVFNNKQTAITSSSTLNSREIRFNELTGNGSEYVALKSPDALGVNVTYTLPGVDGSSGQVLTTNASGVLSWTTVATSGTSLAGDIGGTVGATTIGVGVVDLNHLSATGTASATTYLRGNNTWSSLQTDVQALILSSYVIGASTPIGAGDSVVGAFGKLQKQISDLPVKAVGGDLSGNLPNPTVAKIQGTAVSAAALVTGDFLKYNGTNWLGSQIQIGNLKSSVAGNLFPGAGCLANQTLSYAVLVDAFSCTNIDSLDASKITTGTIAAARLPPSASYWSSATGGVNYAGGNVGIGETIPTSPLTVNGVIESKTGGVKFPDGSVQTVAFTGAAGEASAFRAIRSTLQTFPNGGAATRVLFTTKETDAENVFSTATSLFTASSNGFYHFSTSIAIDNVAVYSGLRITTSSGREVCVTFLKGTASNFRQSCSGSVYLTAGVTVEVVAWQYDTVTTNIQGAYFSGFKVGMGQGVMQAFSDSDGNTKIELEKNTNEDKIRFTTNTTERMIVDNVGNVGIGTSAPTEKLTVAGTIESTSGGVKFPDGTTQTTAGSGGIPAGAVSNFLMNTCPAGYIKANGATISRTTYAALFSAIGTTFGVGDGSTTFKLPDLRGEFVRGWDDARGVDTGRAFGSSQSHMARIPDGTMVKVGSFGNGDGTHDANGVSTVAQANDMSPAPWGNSNTTYPETRPRNIALLSCVKY